MKNKKMAPIGVFDSGVGGLTVAREISRQLPYENIVYFGDTARVPYGSKSQNTIIRFSEQIIRFLRTKQVKAIVIACNTASALALDAGSEVSITVLQCWEQAPGTIQHLATHLCAFRYVLDDDGQFRKHALYRGLHHIAAFLVIYLHIGNSEIGIMLHIFRIGQTYQNIVPVAQRPGLFADKERFC